LQDRSDPRAPRIHDHADREVIASRLIRYRDQTGDDWANIIDFVTIHPDARKTAVRLLAEIDVGRRD